MCLTFFKITYNKDFKAVNTLNIVNFIITIMLIISRDLLKFF